MKKIVLTLALALGLNGFAQSVPFPMEKEVIVYDSNEQVVSMVHGDDSNYSQIIDWVLENGTLLWSEPREKSNGVIGLFLLDNGDYALWFLHKNNPSKTDLFFMSKSI